MRGVFVKKTRITDMSLCGLFAASSAILSQLMIPIGPVPINLTHVSIFIAAGLLGAKNGGLSQLVYVLLGALGAPVFTGFMGGMGVMMGPTGGFVFGYVFCAYLTGFLAERYGRSLKVLPFAMISGMLATYIPGAIWFMFSTNSGVSAALTICVLPFLPGDALKIAVSSILVNKLSPILHRASP
jgi:biotin transport system substrate-specific component